MSVESKLEKLKGLLREASDLGSVNAVLGWDQSTYMPPGGSEARGRQMALLSRLTQDRLADPAIGTLLDELAPLGASLPYESDDAALLRVARRDFERNVKVPAAFVGELTQHQAASYQAWTAARPANDFELVRPFLEKTVQLSRQLAGYFPGADHVADPLIDFSDYGMKAADVRQLFAALRERLVPLVQSITSKEPVDDSVLRRGFPEQEQLAFARDVVRDLGYDFDRGRIDKTHHPFMTKFSIDDVRITTRVRLDDLSDCLFSNLHEAGHAMYEQGIDRSLEGTPLASGTSAGVHESQSRLWENLVGRSRGFWEHLYPRLNDRFPDQLRGVSVDTFYRAINKVQRSLIRTDADEVTYNLHVMLRFEFELQLLEGSLSVKDLPDAWNERYRHDLGVVAPDNRDGVLQDVHWFGGVVGGVFQGYTLGNILSAQFFDAAVTAVPEVPSQITRGEFAGLRNWLTENLYKHGSKFTASEVVERATGRPLSIDPYVTYLKRKYGELYGL